MPGENNAGQMMQNISMIYDLILRKNAAEQAAQQRQEHATNTFVDIVRKMRDPAMVKNFTNVFASTQGLDPNSLMELAQNTSPALDVTQGGVLAEGVKSYGPQDYRESALTATTGGGEGTNAQSHFLGQLFGMARPNADLATALAARVGSGQGLGDYVRGLAQSRMPISQQDQSARIAGGLELDASGKQQGAQFMQSLVQRQAEFSKENDLAWAGHDIQLAGVENQRVANQIDMARVQAAGRQGAMQGRQAAVEELGKAVRFLQEQKAAMSDAELTVHLANANSQIEALKRQGFLPAQTPMLRLEDIMKPGRVTGYPGVGR